MTTELIPVFAANYAKRFLEGLYDQAFQTGFGQRLTALPQWRKYAIEFVLNALAAFFERKLKENTAFRKFVKEVAVDAAPEMAKRLINGVKQDILASATTPEEKEVAQILLELEDRDLLGLIKWLCENEPLEIRRITGQLWRLTPEGVSRLMDFFPEDRKKFFDVLSPRPWPEGTRQGILATMADDVRKLRQKLRQGGRQ